MTTVSGAISFPQTTSTQEAAPDPRTNGGRLVVPPAYMNTTGDSAFQANATDDRVLFGWTQEVAHTLSALSVYVTAVGVQGNITLGLYTADADGEPDTLVFDIGNVDSGAAADTWIRKTFTAQQLYPGTRYCIVASVAADKDVSFSYNRQDAGQSSGLVPGCWAKSTTDGGTTWTDLTKDSQPALLNIVIASTANHVPQLVYGWDGKHGNKTAVYNLGTAVWDLITIPNTGVFKEIGNTGGNDHNVFFTHEGTLDSYADTAKAFRDGIRVGVGGNDDERFLGLVQGIIRVGASYGPIRCETYNTLWNAENQTIQTGYRQPYAGEATKDGQIGWAKLNDYVIKILVGSRQAISATALGQDGAGGAIAIGVDSQIPHPQSLIGCSYSSVTYGGITGKLDALLDEGIHEVFITEKHAGLLYYWQASSTTYQLIWSMNLSYMG